MNKFFVCCIAPVWLLIGVNAAVAQSEPFIISPITPASQTLNITLNTNRILQDRIQNSNQATQSKSALPSTSQKNALTFLSSSALRKRNLEAFVSRMREQNPTNADQMEQLFASADIIGAIGKGLAPFGLRTDNVADAYTVYWMSAWQASIGRTEIFQRDLVVKVKIQVTNALLAIPEIIGATNAQKQEFAEALLVQTALIDASMEQAAGDGNQKRAIASAVRKGASAMGLDLDAMTLTENGFVPAQEGSSIDDHAIPFMPDADRQQRVLAANDDPSRDNTQNYALIAAAGGAGLGGMFLLGKAMGRKR